MMNKLMQLLMARRGTAQGQQPVMGGFGSMMSRMGMQKPAMDAPIAQPMMAPPMSPSEPVPMPKEGPEVAPAVPQMAPMQPKMRLGGGNKSWLKMGM